jgi:sulfate permease, SulP family
MSAGNGPPLLWAILLKRERGKRVRKINKVNSRLQSTSWFSRVTRVVPALDWMPRYQRDQLPGDLVAGIIVAVMLVPQGMAYAMLAGLPPEAGLYASIVPLVIYGLMGTSRPLAVGPVAIVSLMTATAIAPLADEGTSDYIVLALTLALLTGVVQIVMGLIRAGFLVAFLSHPVLSGFMNAAALVIAASQARHLFGVEAGGHTFIEQVSSLIRNLGTMNVTTLLLGAGSLALLFYFRGYARPHLERIGLPTSVAAPLSRVGTLLTVALATIIVWAFALDQEAGVAVTGDVPIGLPPLSAPDWTPDIIVQLLPAAIVISLVGFMESVSVAKTLASRKREKIEPNQELVALGSANLGAAFTGGYPVTGGLSRSVVNDSAGAQSGLASIVTAAFVLVTVLFLTPLFAYLPQATLAAVVLVAVYGLFEAKTLRRTWAYNRADTLALAVTFFAVLLVGIEIGILAGVATSIALFIWHTSQPHIAELGRIKDTDVYRNVRRHETVTDPRLLIIRIDENLYFANSARLEDEITRSIAERSEVEHLVLVGSAINSIDASALETLEELVTRLKVGGVTVHLAEFKGPILDRLQGTLLIQLVGPSRIHLTVNEAIESIFGGEHEVEAPDYATANRR